MDGIEVVRGPPSDLKNLSKSEENDKDSVDNFQKFISELFEKNGVLNDLRAYLRRHIIDVLRSAHAGDTPACQKNLSHRLELKSQAMNILVVEYLLRMEFNYTLSVFVSELPLPNMVFDFASNLMKGAEGDNLRFKDKDVWSIINYLGMKCDASFVSNILEMYKNETKPLLSCLIQSFPLFPMEFPCEEPVSSSDEDVFSDHSSNTLSEKTSKKFPKHSAKCQHHAICKRCHSRLLRLREKCKKKKETERVKESSITSLNLKSLLKNLDGVEGNLVNEMFEQLKDVFDAEVDMIRAEQDRRVQHRLQQQQHTMRQQQQQMEEAFKAREEELERGVRAKKKFLWGLARSLRAQHDQLARAMAAVKYHTQKLKTKEDNLKSQLAQVEQMMKTRGTDMEAQISSELVALESQLHHVRREREAVDREKTELEQLREQISSNHANIDIREIEAVSDKAWSNYDLIKNELSVLRKYIETSRDDPKRVVERSTITDVNAQNVRKTEMFNTEQFVRNPELMNNEQQRVRTPDSFRNEQNVRSPDIFNNEHVARNTEQFNNEQFIKNPQLLNNEQTRNLPMMNNEQVKAARGEDYRFKNNQLVNDFKKSKNVNFCVGNAEDMSVERSVEPRGAEQDVLALLKQENERLREYARQQEQRVSQLQAAAATGRPRTAPATPPPYDPFSDHKPRSSMNELPMTSKLGWRCKGAGEETTLFTCGQPRVFVPGETVPFIGLLHDRHDSRRLMNQWRAARRSSPLRAPHGLPPRVMRTPPHDRTVPRYNQGFVYPNPGYQFQNESQSNQQAQIMTLDPHLSASSSAPARPSSATARAHSPKSLLREAKEKLRTKPSKFTEPPPSTMVREKSPATVLREAKLRLKKLEIEAEAVEQSYLDYRKRQTELRDERELGAPREEAQVTKDVDDLCKYHILYSQSYLDYRKRQTELRDERELGAPREEAQVTKDVDDLCKYHILYSQSYLDYRKRQTELRDERELGAPREEAQVTKDVDDLCKYHILYSQSYLDYRKRQTELRDERELGAPREEAQVTKDVDDLSSKLQSSFQKLHQNQAPSSPVKSDIHCYLQEYHQNLNLSETQFSNRNTTAAKVKPIPEAYSCAQPDNDQTGQANNYLDTPLEEFQKYYRASEGPTRGKSLETGGADRLTPQPSPCDPSPAPPEAPPVDQLTPTVDSLDNAIKELEARKDALIKVKNSKKFELEILKQNITKIYYVLDNDIKNSEKAKGDEVSQDMNDDGSHTPSVTKDKDNVLSIEVDTGNDGSEMKIEAEPKELVVVVQSVDETAVQPDEEGLRGDMTILISPKRSPHCKRSMSPEQAAKLTRNDVLEAIYHADSVKEQVTSNEEVTVTEGPSKANEDGVDATDDDFSADVDNYDLSRTHSSWDYSLGGYPAKYKPGQF